MKIVNQRDLPTDRLSTTDEKGWRVYVLPALAQGFYSTWRARLRFVLIFIFLALPWITVNGHQLVLMDLPGRRFSFFGLTFWAHDAPILFFVLLFLVVSLATATALAGRVWCGWACPQTVFIEGVFRPIERLILGSHLDQRQFYASPNSISKFTRLSAKWFLFFIVSSVVGHSFLAYFVGAERVLHMIAQGPFFHWTNFLIATFATGVVLFDFGWFREQFCIIMCPYGRFQSVLVGKNSYNVMYDPGRGEPRKGSLENTGDKPIGDCINCYKCVAVCPTGVDIRNGTQMECIACTACIDACDEVMEKIKKPKGLIRYASVNSLVGKQAPLLRSRTIFYLSFLSISILGLATVVLLRTPVRLTVLRAQDVPYQSISENNQTKIINHFKIHGQNDEISAVVLSPFYDSKSFEVVLPSGSLMLEAGKNTDVHFFVKFDPDFVKSTGEGEVFIEWRRKRNNALVASQTLKLLGPKGGTE